jgi:hypothetical protein
VENTAAAYPSQRCRGGAGTGRNPKSTHVNIDSAIPDGGCSHGAVSPCRDERLDAARRLQQCALGKGNSNNFPLIWPSVRRFAQFCSYWIRAHIIPFLRVAFTGAQQMIEKAFLPVRLGNCKVDQPFANHVPQRLNPTRQDDSIHWKGYKEMHVIRHYHVPTDGDIMFLRPDKKRTKCLVNFASCQQAFAFVCVESDEINGRALSNRRASRGGRRGHCFVSSLVTPDFLVLVT